MINEEFPDGTLGLEVAFHNTVHEAFNLCNTSGIEASLDNIRDYAIRYINSENCTLLPQEVKNDITILLFDNPENLNAIISEHLSQHQNQDTSYTNLLNELSHHCSTDEAHSDFPIPVPREEEIINISKLLIRDTITTTDQNSIIVIKETVRDIILSEKSGFNLSEQSPIIDMLMKTTLLDSYIQRLTDIKTNILVYNNSKPESLLPYDYLYKTEEIGAILFGSSISEDLTVHIMPNIELYSTNINTDYISHWLIGWCQGILTAQLDATIMIPANTGGHWVSLLIKKQCSNIRIIYLDSGGPQLTESFKNSIISSVENISSVKPEFIDLSFEQQDGPSCGAYTAENLISLAQKEDIMNIDQNAMMSILPTPKSSNALRGKHMACLNALSNNTP